MKPKNSKTTLSLRAVAKQSPLFLHDLGDCFVASLLAKTLLLFLFISQFLFAQEKLNEMRVVGKAEFASDELIDKSNKDDNQKVCAGLIILSDLEGLKFTSYNGVVKLNHDPGRDFLFLSPDERVVEVYCVGFAPLKIILSEVGIKLESGKAWSVKVTGDKPLELIPINIVVTPKDATIFLDGTDKGTSSALQVSPGKHNLRVEKEGYRTVSEAIDVSTTKTLFTYTLQEVEQLQATIKSTPEGATVYLNNAERGITNKALFLFPGTYSLKLSLAGYVDVEKTIEVKENGDNTFPYTLLKNSGILSLETLPTDATVKINDDVKTQKTFELKPGEYKIDVSRINYDTQTETITIKPGDSIKKTYTLIKNTGALSLSISPSDATIKINDEIVTQHTLELKPGEYTIEVSKNNYLSQKDKFEIKLGVELEKTYTLIKNTGTLTLTVSPNDALLFIDKENYRTQRTLELTPAKYKLEIKKDGYYDTTETVDITLGKILERDYALRQKVGKLQFTIQPLETEVKLKRGEMVAYNWTGAKLQKDIPIGDYEIECKASGYKTLKKKIAIEENKTVNEDLVMEKGSDVPEGMVFVEGGTFEMGSNDYDNEKPVHRVTVSDFYIGKYEVTQKEWQEVMGNNPSRNKGDDLPVENVSWNDIQDYLQRLNAKTGGNYRLPTEAELEYAARGGNKSHGYEYSGSNTLDNVAWYYDNSGSKTHSVGTKQPNELGIYDMSGNVWEWCNDWYGENYYSSSSQNNPQGPSSGSVRSAIVTPFVVLRSGTALLPTVVTSASGFGYRGLVNLCTLFYYAIFFLLLFLFQRKRRIRKIFR